MKKNLLTLAASFAASFGIVATGFAANPSFAAVMPESNLSSFVSLQSASSAEFTAVVPTETSEQKWFSTIDMSFPTSVTIVSNHPNIVVRKGNATTGATVSIDDWMCVKQSSPANTVRFFACDYDCYTYPFAMEDDTDYYITIPAGVLSYAGGAKNQEIVLHYKGITTEVALSYTAITPALESELDELGTMNLEFAEAVTIEDRNPDIVVRKGNATSGETVSVIDWLAVDNSSDDKTMTVFPCDYDYYTSPIALDANEDYYVTIPAGTFSNAAGVESEEMVLHYKGITQAEPLTYTAITPAVDSELESLGTMNLEFDEAVSIEDRNPDIVVRKGNATSGETVSVIDWLAVDNSSDDKTMTVFPCDYDYYTSPIALDPEEDYYVTIPAGTFTNAAGVESEEMVLHYKGIPILPLTYSAVTPASGSYLTELGTMQMAFDEAVTVEDRNPDIVVRKGDATSGETVSVIDWLAVDNSSDDKTMTIFPCDYDYYTSPIALEAGVTYYVTIPAGTFANAADVENEAFVLEFTGAAESAAVGTTFEADGLTYEVIREGVVAVTDADNNQASFAVPAEIMSQGASYEVRIIGENAFKWTSAVDVTLPATIDSILYSAFNGSDIVNMVLPAGLKYIGDYAFSCDNLTSINIPSGVTAIPGYCFFSCDNLASVTFEGETLKSIGKSAFYNAPKLTSIEIAASCDSIASSAFLRCSGLESIVLPAGLKTLGEGAFCYCEKLESVTLPSQITYIGDETFLGCEALSSIVIPAAIDSIGAGAFAHTAITAFEVEAGNEAFQAIDGVLYSTDKTLLYQYPCKGDSIYSVEEGCVGIMAGAFWGAGIAEVTLPEGMRAIDYYAFCESNLREINFPKSLIYMGDQALAGTQFTSIVLPENMPYISDGLMAWCYNLTSVTIPAGVEYLYNHAFQTCKALKEVHMLGSVPPGVDDYYSESYNPFGYVERDNVILSVPAGFADVYEESTWGDLFSTIEDTEAAPLTYASINPATESELISLGAITMTFDVAVEVENNKPAIKVIKDDILVGSYVATDEWKAVDNSSDHKSITFFMSDADGFASNVSLESAVDYYVVIPKGTISDGAGKVNEMMRLHYVGGVFSGVEDASAATFNVEQEGMQLIVTLPEASDVTLYNAQGAVVATQEAATQAIFTAPQAGLYIVKMGDTSFKVVVK